MNPWALVFLATRRSSVFMSFKCRRCSPRPDIYFSIMCCVHKSTYPYLLLHHWPLRARLHGRDRFTSFMSSFFVQSFSCTYEGGLIGRVVVSVLRGHLRLSTPLPACIDGVPFFAKSTVMFFVPGRRVLLLPVFRWSPKQADPGGGRFRDILCPMRLILD